MTEYLMGDAHERLPNTKSFPAGVPDYVDTDTRLYMVGPAQFGGTRYCYVITRYDRESDQTTAYFTAHLWDVAQHGPYLGCINGCKGRAAHRKLMARLGYRVVA